MTIDVLPFGAFALESCAAPAPAAAEGWTLTLSLRLDQARGEATTASRVSARSLPAFPLGTEHARIARTQAEPLTITFPPAPAI